METDIANKLLQMPHLCAKHVRGAQLFANRVDALSSIPHADKIAEIGVALGDFSQILIDVFSPSRFDAFDIFTMHEFPEFWGTPTSELLKGCTHRHYYESRFQDQISTGLLRVIEGDSSINLYKQPDHTYDIIYIDGDHGYEGALKDAIAAERKLNTNGTLIFNDYILYDPFSKQPYGVPEVVNTLCVHRGWKVVYFTFHPQMFCDIALQKL